MQQPCSWGGLLHSLDSLGRYKAIVDTLCSLAPNKEAENDQTPDSKIVSVRAYYLRFHPANLSPNVLRGLQPEFDSETNPEETLNSD